MKLKITFLIFTFFITSGFGYSSEEMTIKEFRPDHKIITVKVSENEVQFNTNRKAIEAGAVDLKKIPDAPSDTTCLPDNRWLVIQKNTRKEYCTNKNVIAALQRVFLQVKVITR
jgi:hypothetical protein